MTYFHFFIIEWHMSWWYQIHVNVYICCWCETWLPKKDDHSITTENLPWDVHDIQPSRKRNNFIIQNDSTRQIFSSSHPHQILRYGLLTNHRGRAFLTIYLNLFSSLKQDNIGIFYFNNIYINVPITNKCDQSYWFFSSKTILCQYKEYEIVTTSMTKHNLNFEVILDIYLKCSFSLL